MIDETHCVSQWGRDFRPDYMKLGILKDKFPEVPTMALTATATHKVKLDVVKQLKMKDCLYFQSSFNRENLIYYIREKKKDHLDEIAAFIKNVYDKKSGIIYCLRKNEAEKNLLLLLLRFRVIQHQKMCQILDGIVRSLLCKECNCYPGIERTHNTGIPSAQRRGRKRDNGAPAFAPGYLFPDNNELHSLLCNRCQTGNQRWYHLELEEERHFVLVLVEKGFGGLVAALVLEGTSPVLALSLACSQNQG